MAFSRIMFHQDVHSSIISYSTVTSSTTSIEKHLRELIPHHASVETADRWWASWSWQPWQPLKPDVVHHQSRIQAKEQTMVFNPKQTTPKTLSAFLMSHHLEPLVKQVSAFTWVQIQTYPIHLDIRPQRIHIIWDSWEWIQRSKAL